MNEQALKIRLKTIAKEKRSFFNKVWKQLILERFLVRLSFSEHTKNFIFKGGYLLAYLINIGRETVSNSRRKIANLDPRYISKKPAF